MRKTKRALALALSAVMLMQPVVNTGALKAYAASGDVAINEANFPDAKFREYLSGLEEGEDGILTAAELNARTTLVIPQNADTMKIGDLTGVENFTNLTTLLCRGLSLKSLDVSGLHKLTYLNCGKNSIPELDIDSNPELEYVICDSTDIETLRTTYNLKLKGINCSNTNVWELSVVNSDLLEELYFAGTAVSDIDIASMTNLKSLDCSATTIDSLDLGGCDYLEYLYCDQMLSLNSLDVAGKNHLKYVSCGGSSITDLDASYATNLEVLVCSGKNIGTGFTEEEDNPTDPTQSKKIVEALKSAGPSSLEKLNIEGDTALEILDCSYNKLKAIDVSAYPALRYLDVSSNKLTDESGLSVASNANLTHYYCANNELSEIDISKNAKLLKLNCDGNQLEELNLDNNPALKMVSCSNNHLVCLDVTKCDLENLTVSCAGNTRNIALDTKWYEYKLSQFKGFTQAAENNDKNELGGSLLKKSSESGCVINSYRLIPELGVDKVTYSYFVGKGPQVAKFTLNISNPLKITVLINYGMVDESSVAANAAKSLLKGESVMLTAVHSDSYKAGAENENLNILSDVTWSSSDDNVVEVEKATGKLTAKSAGDAMVYCEIAGITRGYIKVNVSEPVASIQFDEPDITLEKDGTKNTQLLKPTILPEGADKSVTYESSDPTVAGVNKDGMVTAVGAGTAVITCTAKDGSGVYGQCNVTVVQKVASLRLPDQSKYMLVGSTDKVEPIILPENIENKSVTWKSDNPSVVTVDEDGVFKALASGKANITCTSVDNPSRSFLCTVVVLPADLTVELNVTSCNLTKDRADGSGSTYQLEIQNPRSELKDVKFSWKSADESVAKVDNSGKITATGGGRTVVQYVITGMVFAECEVNVTQLCTKIEVTSPVKSLFIGDTAELTAVLTPESTTDKSVKWSSSDEKVAKVDSKGKVTAIGAGSAKISCESQDERKAKGELTLQVVKPVKEISFNKSTVKIFVGQRKGIPVNPASMTNIDVYCKVTPADASNLGIEWTTSNPGVALVSNGTITAVSKGTAVITATAKDGSGKKATIEVTVTQPVTKITLDSAVVALKKGKSTTLKAKVGPSDANKKSVKWETSDPKIVKITSKGKITAKGAVGASATITCTAKDGSGVKTSCRVIIGNPITKVKLNKKSVTVKKGKTVTLKATLSPKAAAYANVIWTSSKTKVATVSNGGVVTGVKKGTATITCTAADGSKKKATCKVTVK